MDGRLRSLLIAWAATNLLFFRRWAQILPGGHDYFLATARPAAQYITLMVVVALVALFAWAAHHGAARLGRPWATGTMRWGFAVVVLLGIRSVLAEGWIFARAPWPLWWMDIGLGCLLLATAGLLYWRKPGWHHRIVPIAVATTMLLAPLLPIMYAQGVYLAATADDTAKDLTPRSADLQGGAGPGGRIVWLVMDEMDQRLTFEETPEGFATPELDRLRDTSLHADHAFAPAAATLRSMPAMTTGQLVMEAKARGADELRLRSVDGDTMSWGASETVFHRAYDAGLDVGVVGNYHPYCRVFEGVLARCHFESYFQEERGPMQMTADHVTNLVRAVPGVSMREILVRDPVDWLESGARMAQERDIDNYQGLHAAGLSMAADPDLDLVLLHYNVPHPSGGPGHSRGFYDPDTGRLVTGAGASYFDNLLLADRTIGELRLAMEAAGVWEETTFIVTADHGYRYGYWGSSEATRRYGDLLHQPTSHRVPFILHTPGNIEARLYEQPFNLIVMADLLESVWRGDIQNPDAGAAWLDAHRTIGPAPSYTRR